jgi:hypothetical protein
MGDRLYAPARLRRRPRFEAVRTNAPTSKHSNANASIKNTFPEPVNGNDPLLEVVDVPETLVAVVVVTDPRVVTVA